MTDYKPNGMTVVTAEDEQGKFIMAVNRLIKCVYDHDDLGTFYAAEAIYFSDAYRVQNSDTCLDDVIKKASSNDAKALDDAVIHFLDNLSLLNVYTTEYDLAHACYAGKKWRDDVWDQNTAFNGQVIYFNSSDIKQKYFPVSHEFIRKTNDEVLPF